MYVRADGSVFTNSIWDEDGYQASVYKEGKFITSMSYPRGGGHTATWLRMTRTYSSLRWMTTRVTTNMSSPLAAEWRYTAPFHPITASTYTDDGSFLAVNTNGITGLALIDNRLFVGDPEANQAKVYDTETMAPVTPPVALARRDKFDRCSRCRRGSAGRMQTEQLVALHVGAVASSEGTCREDAAASSPTLKYSDRPSAHADAQMRSVKQR